MHVVIAKLLTCSSDTTASLVIEQWHVILSRYIVQRIVEIRQRFMVVSRDEF